MGVAPPSTNWVAPQASDALFIPPPRRDVGVAQAALGAQHNDALFIPPPRRDVGVKRESMPPPVDDSKFSDNDKEISPPDYVSAVENAQPQEKKTKKKKTKKTKPKPTTSGSESADAVVISVSESDHVVADDAASRI
jgi:hypothetical protein